MTVALGLRESTSGMILSRQFSAMTKTWGEKGIEAFSPDFYLAG